MRRKAKKQCAATDVHVGRRIRLRRKTLRLAAKGLAGKLGISDQQLVKYETGKNRVGASRLYDIALMLRVPISYFYEGLSASVGDANAAATITADAMGPIGQLDTQAVKLALAYARIRNPIKRRQIAKLIEALADIDGA